MLCRRICRLLPGALLLPLLERLLTARFAQLLAGGRNRRNRRSIGARRHGVGARVLRRLVGEHLSRFFTPAAKRGRLFHGLAVLVRIPGKARLLTARLLWHARLVLISLSAH